MPGEFNNEFNNEFAIDSNAFAAAHWCLIDDELIWIGEWDASYSYSLNDTVLYKSDGASEWHVFISKTSHNVGNTPTTSAAHWRRRYQEQWL